MTGYTSSIGVMSYDTACSRNRINPFVIPHSIHVEYSDHAKGEIAIFIFIFLVKIAGYTNMIFLKEIFIDFYIIFKWAMKKY